MNMITTLLSPIESESPLMPWSSVNTTNYDRKGYEKQLMKHDNKMGINMRVVRQTANHTLNTY